MTADISTSQTSIPASPKTPEQKLISSLSYHRQSMKIYQEANKVMKTMGQNEVEVAIVDTASMEFDAKCDINKISIADKKTKKEKKALLIFELTNVIHSPRFAKVYKKLNKGKFKTAEKYTKHMEKVEYDGLCRYLDVMKKIKIDDGKWGWVRKEHKVRRGFKHYYNHLLDNSHKEYYRKIWQDWYNESSKTQ